MVHDPPEPDKDASAQPPDSAGADPDRPAPRTNGRRWPAASVTASEPTSPVAVEPSATPNGESWTVGRLLNWTSDFLKKRGSESPRLDAEVLLAKVLGWQRVQLYTHHEEEVGERARGEFRELVRRRADGSPVAYLVGRKEFYSIPLQVTPAVLIPRPDSEFVVVEFLEIAGKLESPRCVDVGTGSGCLALACTNEHKSARFHAIDISPEALEVARSNAESLGVADRIIFREGDLLGPVAAEGPFDVILSNPPYIPTEVIGTLEVGVRSFEPHRALDGGPDGLRVADRLIEQAIPLLRPGGHLLLEIGTDQELPIRAMIGAHPEMIVAPTVRDHGNHPRVIRASKRSESAPQSGTRGGGDD